MHEVQEEIKSQKYKWLKKLGIWTIVFFVVKGTISTILIYYFGKGIWQYVAEWFK